MAYKERLRPKGVYFSRFRNIKGSGLYSLRYTKGQGNLSCWSVKGPKALKDEFYGFLMSRKRSIFVIDSYQERINGTEKASPMHTHPIP